MLTSTQLEQYRRDGFLIVHDFFAIEELQPVMDEIDDQVDELADKLYAAGKVRRKHEDEGFYTRLTALEREFPGSAVLLHTRGILDPALAGLWGSSKLLDIVEQLIGPNIAGHPVWNLRCKTPDNPLATVPWHQDTAYLAKGVHTTHQPTAWIPLIDANLTNGTLQVIPGGHRPGNVVRHSLERTRGGHEESWYLDIDEEDLPTGDVVTCEMKMGSFLLINQLIPHRSTENHSDKIRWSVDLRWQRPDEPSGFGKIKPCILMRTADDPDYKIDWERWARNSRMEIVKQRAGSEADDSFGTTVTGPWLNRWSKQAPSRE